MKLPQMKRWLVLAAAIFFGTLVAGCGPDYPECESEDDCSEQGEHCNSGKCSQCSTNAHCNDPSMQCESGRCSMIPGYCDENNACPPEKPRCVSNRCDYECNVAEDCGDPRMGCEDHKCTPYQCVTNEDCEAGQRCENHECVGIPLCEMQPIFFDFDEHAIRSDAQDVLQSNKGCFDERANMGSEVGSVQIVGHTDARGTEEYNMALGEKRARQTQRALSRLGVPNGKISTDSRGEYDLAVPNATSESQHQRNRRAMFQLQ